MEFVVCNAFALTIGGGTGVSYGDSALENEIIQLENQLAQKQEELNKCAQKNKNFKIAGITTVGLTGVGAVANISIAKKNKDMSQQIQKMNNKIQTLEKQEEELANEFEKLLENLDEQKFDNEIKKTLTAEEENRMKHLLLEADLVLEDLSESDKAILKKYMTALRISQKTKN